MTPDPNLAGLAPIAWSDRARWSPSAMAEAHDICSRLGLDLAAAVGATTVPAGGLSSEALHRIGALIGIDRALGVVLGEQGPDWLRRPNAGPAFGGRTPAALIEGGGLGGLLAVRGVVDAARGGTFAAMEAGESAPVRLVIA